MRKNEMTQSETNRYQLSTKAVDELSNRSIGKLQPVLTLDEHATPFTVLDTFDQVLRHSGRLLIETGSSFQLLLTDGRTLFQSSKRNGQFVADFSDGPVKWALADLSSLRSLLPIGTGTVRSGCISLLDDDQKTHCRAHLQIWAESKVESAVIVTLQGLRGYDRSLAELRKRVKVCRGTYLDLGDLYDGIDPKIRDYSAKPRVGVRPDDSAFRTATKIISTYIPVVLANEDGIIADHDTEFLHDYRIALRKIRSILGLFKDVYEEKQTAELKTRFAALMAPTGRLRDLDVYLLNKDQFYQLLPKTLHAGLDTMFGMYAEERKVAKAKLVGHLQSDDYRHEISKLAKLFSKRKKLIPGRSAHVEAYDFACGRIWKRYRTICAVADDIGPETEDAVLHSLRIHCKKLRYLLEFFAPLFPKPDVAALLKGLKDLQDILGRFNDCSVQQISLQDFLAETNNWPHGVDLGVAQSVGALTTILHRQQIDLRQKVASSFSRFNSTTTQDTFHDLFHGRKDRK